MRRLQLERLRQKHAQAFIAQIASFYRTQPNNQDKRTQGMTSSRKEKKLSQSGRALPSRAAFPEAVG